MCLWFVHTDKNVDRQVFSWITNGSINWNRCGGKQFGGMLNYPLIFNSSLQSRILLRKYSRWTKIYARKDAHLILTITTIAS